MGRSVGADSAAGHDQAVIRVHGRTGNEQILEAVNVPGIHRAGFGGLDVPMVKPIRKVDVANVVELIEESVLLGEKVCFPFDAVVAVELPDPTNNFFVRLA